MCSGIHLGSIEMGSLQITLVFTKTFNLSKEGFPSMNIPLTLYRAQRRRIESRLRKTRNRIETLRCRILLLLNAGETPGAIHRKVDCARATVYRTLYRFEDRGESSLSDLRFTSKPRKVTDDLRERLMAVLDLSPQQQGWSRSTWTLELLSKEILEQTGIKLSISHVRNLLLEMGCRRGRPRPALRIPVRGRRRVLENISRLVKRASSKHEVFYVDEADVDLNPRIGPAYMKKGQQPLVITPGKNRKQYLAGALNARTGSLVYTCGEKKNSTLFLSLMEHLNWSYRRAESIHLVLDNYIIHKSRQTLAWLRRFGSRIVLHFLPPYSPESNVIERLWKQMHDHVTRNHRHTTMESLMQAVFQFLRVVQPFPGTKVSTMTMAA